MEVFMKASIISRNLTVKCIFLGSSKEAKKHMKELRSEDILEHSSDIAPKMYNSEYMWGLWDVECVVGESFSIAPHEAGIPV